jgi:cytochrome b subunit of formate dehydrogenase
MEKEAAIIPGCARMTTSADVTRRFSVSDRIEHWVQMGAFVALAVTGLIQRYDGAWVSQRLIDAMSGVEVVRDIHRVFATALMIAVVYHFGSALYRRYVLGRPRTMVPGLADAKAVGGSMKYAFGRAQHPPAQGRFAWEEKVEYWSFVWGTVIMVLTGFLLWNPIATTNLLPGEVVPAAKVFHGGEAVLAVLAILIWHTWHVHIGHSNKSMFTGILSRKEMEELHPLELASIDAGEYPLPPPEERARRTKRFAVIYGALSIVMLGGVYLFVTFEETAIETIKPAEQVEVFAPVETLPPGAITTTITPPVTATTTTTSTTTTAAGGAAVTTTTVAAAGDTWDGGVWALFAPTCTGCHGASQQMSGLDLSSYDSTLAGGATGPGVVPGDSGSSVVVTVMESGSHPALLSAEDLGVLTDWIDAGAAEN